MSKNKNSSGHQAPSPQSIEEMSIQQLVEEAKRIKQIMRDGKGRIGAQTALPPAQAAEPSIVKLTDDEQCLLDAMLLAGGSRGADGLRLWLGARGAVRTTSGRPFMPADISLGLKSLHRQGLLKLQSSHGFAADLQQHGQRLQSLLLNKELAAQNWRHIAWMFSGGFGDPQRTPTWLSFRGPGECRTMLRALIFSGMSLAQFQDLMQHWPELQDLDSMAQVMTQPWMPAALAQIAPDLLSDLLTQILLAFPANDASITPLRRWLKEEFDRDPARVSPGLRVYLAESQALALNFEGVAPLLKGLSGPLVDGFAAIQKASQGQWAPACAELELGIKEIRRLSKQRRGSLSPEFTRLYIASLLAQDDPKLWDAARKYCIAESGSRNPSPHELWGRWAHAIGARLGETAFDPTCVQYLPALEEREASLSQSADRLLLAAWLGKPAPGWTPLAAQKLAQGLAAAGRLWLAAWTAQAAERLELGKPPLDLQGKPWPASFLGQPREAWRDALAAISALAVASEGKSSEAKRSELAWSLQLDEEGRVQNLLPLERSVSAKGVEKLKPITLAKLKKGSELAAARDNAVLRHIERIPYGGANSFQLDLSQAAIALIGHPALMLEDAPGQWIELAEAQPELEVLRKNAGEAGGSDCFEFRLHPPLLSRSSPRLQGWMGTNFELESAKREALRIVRDGPQRARLIRISAAQRRVAELVAQGWTVPASASAELGAALQVLSAHFQLHSDAQAGQRVPGDSRLHAQLKPQGEGLQLQLVAQPFGGFGPAVTPGQGRAQLMCMHEGVSLMTERDLAAEQAARQQVLEALPFLDPELSPASPWNLNDAEEALHAVEVLPGLSGIAALAWPKGKPLRVSPVNSTALTLQVSSGRDWLGLNGEAQLDEQRVLSLQELMTLARASRSRFVRLGEGEYLALSEQLRQQLRDLDALGQSKKDQLLLPQAAASWLDATLSDMRLQGDSPWLARMDTLSQAAALQPKTPAGLRAELRGYQLEGYAWMTRLAHAGLGACLADDMGLGKTVQTLALLLDRAAKGPALVLAPTSVCGNWLSETHSFAPGLRCRIYGEEADKAERAAAIAEAGPGDVLVVSYALAQIDGEALAEKTWATLVMDEAQALKNAATKRAKSVGEFKADFRLALSGTPVENRLADLWSIMNLINPGLLGAATQFGERFANPIEKQQDAAARQRLRRLVSPFLLRRTKAQVLQDLPPRTEIVHLVQPSSEERNFLEALRRSAQEAVAKAAAQGQAAPMQVLAELMRLRRAACDPRLVSAELGLVGAKMAEFERVVRELVEGSHKALVFSQFTDYLKLLAERLDAMGVSYQYLDGSTPAAERTKRVAAFQRGEGEVFLISLKAGGFGLNLTMADYVLIVDPWWNPAAEDQATGRAHRMGQKRPVTVYRLVTAGSVEERIIDLHRDKRGLADGILEGQEEATVLDAKALAALLQG
ncbi:superfamily II DNA or RNA helicase [Paucibacter oligotrophus]|uniref:Superfamily II DNA or RNA helicase n=1 Tax=Roseateles oligotrophus TaxID=1769250 RepID=A0A840L415_9BURK|nr:DEAD/DEAH box helicase [Roseateles oligotrophus]MBB4842541.1 superfamily II DNA or RNA helicase [Roseateles oligotrophus]